MNVMSNLTYTNRYIFALSLIAFFSISAYLNLEQLISSQSNDGEIINISGKQRMLSQRIALYALEDNQLLLGKTIDMMSKAHTKLISLPMSDKIKNRYFSRPMMLHDKIGEYIKYATSFNKTQSKEDLKYILKHSQLLVKDLDILVSMYQKEAEEKISRLHDNELYLLLLTLITLLVEAFFIFKPANDEVMKKTEELVLEKEYLNTITQANTNAIIAVDHNFEILTFNDSAEKIFGFTQEEMLHTKLTDDRIIPLKYLKNHNNGLANFVKTGKLKNIDETFELEAQKKDKTLFPIRISFGIKIDKDSKIVVANIQDITQEKLQEKLLYQQTRLAQMGEMISMIAHQWRQPLGAINTAIMSINTKRKLGKFDLNKEEDRERFFAFMDKKHTNVLSYVQGLSQTIDDFRNFFKPNKAKEVVSITQPIENALDIVEASMESKGIKIERRYEDNSEISLYQNELMQVVLNILKNAQDNFIEKSIKDAKIEISTRVEEKEHIITIRDNGGGIADDILPKIFDPYFSTKDERNGTGLGLYMSKTIVEEHHNGALNAVNDKNGIVFEIKILQG